MTDGEIATIFARVTGFMIDAEQPDLIGFARAIEQASRRAALEEAKQICIDREARVEPVTKGDCEWFTGLSEGIKTGARHCASEIDEAIRKLAKETNNG